MTRLHGDWSVCMMPLNSSQHIYQLQGLHKLYLVPHIQCFLPTRCCRPSKWSFRDEDSILDQIYKNRIRNVKNLIFDVNHIYIHIHNRIAIWKQDSDQISSCSAVLLLVILIWFSSNGNSNLKKKKKYCSFRNIKFQLGKGIDQSTKKCLFGKVLK